MRYRVSCWALQKNNAMMTKIILVRHGYSVTNAAKRYTGQADVPLTDVGRAQAEQIADYLIAHERIDAVYASDLSRAMDTAGPTAARFGLTVTPVRELRELAMGIWEGMRFEDVARDYRDVLLLRERDYTYPCPGGESFAELYARISGAITRLARENEGKCIMLVSHGGAVRTARCMAAGDGPQHAQHYPSSENAAISIYCFENDRLTLLQENITAHLKLPDTPSAPPQLY